MESLIGELCDLILLLKKAQVDGEILGISGWHDGCDAWLECRLTAIGFERVDRMIGKNYDEYECVGDWEMLKVGKLYVICETATQIERKAR